MSETSKRGISVSDPKSAREAWEPPQVLVEDIRDTASPFASVHRADGAGPGIYYNPS